MRKIARDRILKRDGYKCAYCGSKERLEIDHIIPLSKNGRHSEDNFQILCRPCNRKKKDTFDPDRIIDKWFILDKDPEHIGIKKGFDCFQINSIEFKKMLERAFERHAEIFGICYE